MRDNTTHAILHFFNAEYDPKKLPVIKKFLFELSECQDFVDELCKQIKLGGGKLPLLDEQTI
jgi:hypothetical protein